MKAYIRFCTLALSSLLLPLSITSAQSCGDFIFPYEDYIDEETVVLEERIPIEDCGNPFNGDVPEPYPYVITIDNQSVTDNAVLILPESESVNVNYFINKGSGTYRTSFHLYKKAGEDYLHIASKDRESFVLPAVSAGEYVAVLSYVEFSAQAKRKSGWFEWIATLFLPQVATAFYENYEDIVVVPFTVQYEIPEPIGASSVLFLPGIQASRLYVEGLLGTENQLWEPNTDADVQKLAMSESGVSVNDVYTKDVLDEVNVLPVIQGNIYKGFLNRLDKLKQGNIIADSSAFAYDWRYSVEDVATKYVLYGAGTRKRLLQEVRNLAADSYTGKVTIIAHSNGGLVAKALLHEYGENELSGLVDKVIFVGTPQLGTPKAIGSMLHGLDQSLGYGLIARAGTIREVTKNLPGAYTLLPSPKYFEVADEAMITTDGSMVSKIVSDYGEITSASQLQDFLLNSLTNRQDSNGLSEPLILNNQLAQDAFRIQGVLDNWQAPAGVSIYEVVGTGLATIKGYQYREFGCADINNPTCVLNSYLKPFPIMSNDGDETVMAISAEGYDGNKVTARVNMVDENDQFLTLDRKHKNLTESQVVQEFIESVLKYSYLTDSLVVPEFTEVSSRYILIGAHSPVTLKATDEEGNVVGVLGNEVREDIVGSQYFELGGSSYLVLPREASVKIVVEGAENGVYSLSVDEINGSGEQSEISLLASATTTPEMLAEFTMQGGTYSSIQTDIDGDGVFDLEQTLDGEVVLQPIESYSYSDLKTAIKDLQLGRGYEKNLLVKVSLAEKFAQRANKKQVFKKIETATLSYLLKILNWYQLRGIITSDSYTQIQNIIANLE